MRRLSRMLLMAATLSFLVLCLVIAALGIRSYLVSDHFFYSRIEPAPPWVRWSQGHLATGRGGIGLMWSVQAFPAQVRAGLERRNSPSRHLSKEPAYPDFRFDERPTIYGFQYGHIAHGPRTSGPFAGMPGSSGTQLIVPLWCPLLLFALLAAPGTRSWHRRRRARRRQLANRCTSCGYDLRGSPERCPECGALPENSALAS